MPEHTDDYQEQAHGPKNDGRENITSEEFVSSAEQFSVFSSRQKRAIVVAGSCAAFFSPVSSNIYFPALVTIAKDLRVSLSQINLTITTYQVSLIISFMSKISLPMSSHDWTVDDNHSRSCKVSHRCS